MDNLSIVVYTANFGNYRDELKNGIDNVFFDKNIDYFFFTDNINIKSNQWNVIYTPLKSEYDFIDTFRHTSKYIKFIVPEILHKYDIIIWIDSKNLDKIHFTKNKIIKLFTVDQNKMFFIKNPFRSICHDELKETVRLKFEHPNNANNFSIEISNLHFNTNLPDTTCIVYMNKKDNILMLKDVYDTLISKGLRRDQNVIQYVWLKNNYENRISYFNFHDL